MISKLTLKSIIDKYYLGTNEAVKWEIKDKVLSIRFMSPSNDVIGKVQYSNFPLEDNTLAIFDTKKLLNLLSICSGDILLEVEKQKDFPIKLKISDFNFNVIYALSDLLLISKVGTVNIPSYNVKLVLDQEHIDNLIKAKGALAGVNKMIINTIEDSETKEKVCEFIFGDEVGYNNKITYKISGEISENNLKLPFNSDTFKNILYANRDMGEGKLYLSSNGLMKLEFYEKDFHSEYYMVRNEEQDF